MKTSMRLIICLLAAITMENIRVEGKLQPKNYFIHPSPHFQNTNNVPKTHGVQTTHSYNIKNSLEILGEFAKGTMEIFKNGATSVTAQSTNKRDEDQLEDYAMTAKTPKLTLNSRALKMGAADNLNRNSYVYTSPKFILHGSEKKVELPVYQGELPEYALDYLFTRNKYRELLTGLCLYNLGFGQSLAIKYKVDDICTFCIKDTKKIIDKFSIDCDKIGLSVDPTAQKVTINKRKTSKSLLLGVSDPVLYGPVVEVTTDMVCSVQIAMKEKSIPCSQLQMYFEQSFNVKSSASFNTLYFVALVPSMIMYL